MYLFFFFSPCLLHFTFLPEGISQASGNGAQVRMKLLKAPQREEGPGIWLPDNNYCLSFGGLFLLGMAKTFFYTAVEKHQKGVEPK